MAAEETLTAAQQTADEIKASAEQLVFQLVQLASELPTPPEIAAVSVQIQFKDGVGAVLQTWTGDLIKR